MGWGVSKRDCVLLYGIMCVSKQDGLLVCGMRYSFRGWGLYMGWSVGNGMGC